MAPKKHKKQHGGKGLLHIGKSRGKKDAANKKKQKQKPKKGESKFMSMLKAGGKKMQAKMKSRGAQLEAKMKKKGLEMRAKMKSKGNELRKRMKDKVHETSVEMKKKMREKGTEMKKKMRETGHKMKEGGKDWKGKMKAKGKGLRGEMKKKLKETGEMMKHAEEEMGKESTADVTSKLVTLRQTFEDKGWAVGKVYNDWATLMLMGLNAFTAVMSLIVFGTSASIASKLKKQCLNLMLSPAVTVGFLFSICLLFVSIAGFIGVWFNRLGIVKVHFFTTSVLVGMLFVFTLYGFGVTYRGRGVKLPEGINFKLYNITSYSKYLQNKVKDGKRWNDIRDCISKKSFCDNWNISTPEQLYTASLTSTQLGCCAPPFVCGFAYQGGTQWKLPAFPQADPDCMMWSETALCLDCKSCRAGVLQNVKSIWYKASIVNIVVIVALGAILYRTWFVMRVAGRWNSVAVTVKKAVKPEKEKEEEQSVIDIGEDVHEDEHRDVEEEEDLLVPAWLENDVPEDEIPKISKSSANEDDDDDDTSTTSSRKKKQAKGKKKKKPSETSESANSEESVESSETGKSKRSRKREKREKRKQKKAESEPQDDDSWASPRQQADAATTGGAFPSGFLAQNPLTTMSPWLQSPEAAYLQQGGGMQAYFPGQTPEDYMQAYYQTDPYGQQMLAYDPSIQGYMQQQDPYMQDPMQMMYAQDPQYQMYMQDPQMQMYMQPDQSQGYYMEDPSQAFYGMQDPNQAYNFQGYMQDPNQAGYMQQQQQPGYFNQPWQNPPY